MTVKEGGTMRRRLVTAAAFALGAYAGIRPWFMRWGATGEELVVPLPGDDIVPVARYQATRAITVEAPINEVWPWVVQMGQDRAGLYSYECLENLFGCDIHNGDRIVPEWQERRVGDPFPLHPDLALEVARVDAPTALVLRAPDGSASWAFVLHEHEGDGTRVVVRFRASARSFGLAPVHFVMERRMLLGLKERAERLSAPNVAPRAAA
jgi:hypothetical protein